MTQQSDRGNEFALLVFGKVPRESPNQATLDQDWSNAEDRLFDWFLRVRRNVFAHHLTIEINSVARFTVGILTVAVSIVLQFTKSKPDLTSTLTGITTALALILTFIQQQNNDAKHLATANAYSAIRRKLEAIDGTPRSERGDIKTMLSEINALIDEVGKSAPPITNIVWRWARHRADAHKANEIFLGRSSRTTKQN